MNQPLTDSWAKLERAKAHVDQLRAEILEAGDPDAEEVILRRQFEAESQSVVWRVERLIKVQDCWGLLIGDAVHNFRCSLDHLWWQLALRKLGRVPTEQEARQIQFPIYSKKDGWDNTRFLSHVSSEAADKVEPLQPCSASKRPEIFGLIPGGGLTLLHPLAALAALSNVDKHQVVHIAFHHASASENKLPTMSDFRDCIPDRGRPDTYLPGWYSSSVWNRPIRRGDPMFEVFVIPTGPNPDVEMNPRVTGYVAVGEAWNALATLDAIGEWVVAILDCFDPVAQRGSAL